MTTLPSVTTLAKHELTDTEHDVLDDIFRLAESHSAECRETRQALMKSGASGDGKRGSDELGAYEWAITSLCARIAPAALARVPILAPLNDTSGRLIGLGNPGEEENLERFLRPIFEEAGIGDSFVV